MLGSAKRAVAIFLVATVGLVATAHQAVADNNKPSFDCTKAAEISEKIICSSEKLSALDRELASIYSERLAELDSFGRAALQRDQKRWLNDRTRFCAPRLRGESQNRPDCIEHKYRQRIFALRGDCEVDMDNSLEDMAAWKHAREWERPHSNKIPKGFSAKRDVEMYVNNEFIVVYNLPSDHLPEASTSKWGMRCCASNWLSSCKVTAPDGSEWLAFYGAESFDYARLGVVDYAPHPNLEAASIYDAQQEREYKERQERLKQQQR